MDWITTSGSSIDEAKSHALDQLGIVADEAEFDIVNDVEKGFFGKVKVEARVRARVRPRQPAAKDDRNRRGSGGGNNRNRSRNRNRNKKNQGQNGGGGGQQQPKSDRKSDGGGREQSRGSNGRGKSGGGGSQGSKQQPASDSDNTKQKSGGGRQDGNRSKEGAKAQQATGQDAKAPARQQQAGKQDNVSNDDFSREDQTRVATDFLNGVLERFELVGTVTPDPEPAEDNAIEISVTGEGLGLLVGQKGNTLNALQELTRTVVQRSSDGAKTERLRVDVAGYRERRRAALQDFARKIATDVLDSGEEKILEPMGPADRKVVHDTINEMDGVETGSEGEEPRRRVVIRPA